MSIFDGAFNEPAIPLPPKFHEVITGGFTFPTDYPIVTGGFTPDASRTLKGVIDHVITEYYYDHRINYYVVADFERHFKNRLYKKMLQHQYWIDQFLRLIDDNQFFFNDEEQNFSRDITGNSLSKTSDTPQNSVADIDNYLTSADKSSSDATATEHNTIHKSTLGDITVQFNNFAHFPEFVDGIIESVAPVFMHYYGDEEVDYGTTV